MNDKAKTVFQGKIFEVVTKNVEIEGKEFRRDIIIHHGGVALCCVRDGKILLVSQTRAAVEQKTLEIPAGTIEPGEDPRVTGMRELNEEAGLQCRSMDLITAFWPTPGYDTEVIYVYDCREISEVSQRRPMDAGEDIQSCWMDLKEAAAMIKDGTIRDGKTIIAIYYSLLQEKRD